MPLWHLADDAFNAVAAVVAVSEVAGTLHKSRHIGVVQQPVRLPTQLLLVLLEITHCVFVKEIGHRLGFDGLAIHGEALVQVGHLIAGHAHHPLDVVQAGLRRIAKDHDIATRRLVAFNDLGVDDRQPDAIGELVHQNQVAHQQGGNHGTGRDLEGLEKERAQKEHRSDHRKQAGSPVQPPGLHQDAALGLLHVHIHLLDAHAVEFGAALYGRILDGLRRPAPARQKNHALCQPVGPGNHGGQKQQQRKVALDGAHVPGADVARKGSEHQRSQDLHELHQSSTCKMARNASWGTSTEPICFMRFLPAFCFSRSLRLRLTSPP